MTKNLNPKVTIMIPTFNQMAFIGEAIDSALSQTYSNLEIIVGDDASTDSTAKTVGRINDPRLKYIRNPVNLGRTANYRNLLNNHATGDYVVNLDGDDYYTDYDFISAAINTILSDPGTVMVVAKATTKTLNGDFISRIPNLRVSTGINILRNLPRAEYTMMHMAVVYSRMHAIDLDFYRSEATSSDLESLYRLSLRGKVRYLDKNIGVWRQHDTNETGIIDLTKLTANLRIWKPIYREANLFGMSKWLEVFLCARCIANYASSSCIKISRNDNKKLAKFLFQVVKEFKLPAVFFVIFPKYGVRILLSLLGYYRCKNI